MDEQNVKNLVANFKCNGCDQHFEPDNADVVAHNGDLWVFAVYCPSCQVKSLLAAVIKEGGVPEVVTELSEEEQARLSTPVCSDDLLDLHLFLRDFDGDFSFLLPE